MKRRATEFLLVFLCGAVGAGAAFSADRAGSGSVNRKKKVDLKISAQVNRAVLYGKSGETDETFFVDNDNSSTRLRIVGKGAVDDRLDVGAQIEVEIESNSSGNIRFKQGGPANRTFRERKIEIFFKHKGLGNLWLGQGSTASDGTSEVNLSKTTVIAGADVRDMAGGLAFRIPGAGFGPRVGQVFSDFDGLGRNDRVRYDTPKLRGWQASTSIDDDDSWDVALRYSRKFGGVKIAAAASYVHAHQKTQGFRTQHGGSISVLFPIGFNATFAYGERQISQRVDPMFWYVNLGWIMDLIDYGATAVTVDYGRTDDRNAVGDEGTAYGAYIVQHISHVGTEIYAGIRLHKLDRPAVRLNDVLGAMAGARVKF